MRRRRSDQMRTYSVPGISCDHCKAAIEAEVATVPGVSAVEVDVDAKTVSVDGDPADEAGYEVASVG
jgi:copper chaperone